MTTEGYALLPIEELHESPLNPRKRFNEAGLQELAVSIAAKGVLAPLLVRPNAKGYEIGAGHRRYRAAKIAGVGQVPAVVRNMTDADFLELIVVENDQREDVHPLEQAGGYKALMLLDGYNAQRIADRIGRSEKWVYDRLKLLALSPLAQKLFLADRISAGHAILLARLTHEQQTLAIGDPDAQDRRDNGGLFEGEYSLFTDEEDETREKARKKDPLAAFDGMKAKSVRELDAWIAEHIRFDAKKADPFLFPQVVAAVTETPKPLVPLTRNHYVQEEARDGKVRTYGPASWKEATKPCQYAQGGIIVVGAGRGDVLQVCLSSNRERCDVHWKKERAEAARRAKQREKGGSSSRTTEPKEQPWQREQRLRQAEQARYKIAAPAIFKALASAIEKASLEKVGRAVVDHCSDEHGRLVKPSDYLPLGKTADSILRHALFCILVGEAPAYDVDQDLPRIGKAWGVDVAAILDREAPKPKPAKKAATKAGAPNKKAAKK